MTCQLETLPAAGEELSRAEKLRRAVAWRRRRLIEATHKLVTDPAVVPRNLARLVQRRRSRGAPEPATSSRPAPLRLRAGDRVRVKPLEEILASLDELGRHQGLPYLPWVMAQYSGRTFTVKKRIDQFFDERTRRMLRPRDVVILEGVFCEPEPDAHLPFAGCDRTCFLFWKESWLEKVDSAVCR